MSILLNQRNEECHSTLYILSGERFENRVKLDWPPPFHVNDTSIYIVGKTSVRGTLCIVQEVAYYPKCVFWNPTIDEFKVIPSSPFVPKPIVVSNGFGYDHVGDDYKVIRWLSADEYVDPIWEIYSLRSNSWRKLDIDMPRRDDESVVVYMDGMCHWWGIKGDKEYVVSFDLSNEIFLTTPVPLDMYDGSNFEFVERHMAVMNMSITLISNYARNTTFHISVLGQLGVRESWTKLFIVGPLFGVEHPIGVGEKGNIFFRKENSELAYYDLSTEIIEEIDIQGESHFCQIVIYK
jgi:molecular chaperone HtpG